MLCNIKGITNNLIKILKKIVSVKLNNKISVIVIGVVIF